MDQSYVHLDRARAAELGDLGEHSPSTGPQVLTHVFEKLDPGLVRIVLKRKHHGVGAGSALAPLQTELSRVCIRAALIVPARKNCHSEASQDLLLWENLLVERMTKRVLVRKVGAHRRHVQACWT